MSTANLETDEVIREVFDVRVGDYSPSMGLVASALAAGAFGRPMRRTRRTPRQRRDGKPNNRSVRRGQIPGSFKRRR